jgi:hypothetical protein
MKNIMIIKVDFCKTFGTNNMVNTIISTSTSNDVVGLQRQWVINLKPKVQAIVKFPCDQRCKLTICI